MRCLPILLTIVALPLLAARQVQARESGTYPTVTRERLEEPGPGGLADVPPHLQRLGLQPARPDYGSQRS